MAEENTVADVIKVSARSAHDTGSPEVQVSLLSNRIQALTQSHFKEHPKDKHSRRGLMKMIHQRQRLLNYLWRKDRSRYLAIVANLGLRDKKKALKG